MENENIPVFRPEENQTPEIGIPINNELIEVNKAQLAALLQQNKEFKEIMASAIHIIGFIKSDFFGGEFPTKVDVMAISKILMKLPKLVKNLDEEKIETLKLHMNVVQQASKYLSAEQLKMIATHE